MKKLIATALLLVTFMSNAQIAEEKTGKQREEVVSAPMLICSTTDRTKWFAIVPIFKKFEGILTKSYLSTLKLNIGKCSENDEIVFIFKDGRKMRIPAANEKNCDGIVEIKFPLNSIDIAFLETKTLESIRYINGHDGASFLYLPTKGEADYFTRTFKDLKR
jgi:hypothetical protein